MISRATLKHWLAYDARTGLFRWRKSNGRRAGRGAVAGSIQVKGQIHIGLCGRYYQAHRLAWLYIYGVWPSQLDHADVCRSNNRIRNLRLATNQQNAVNKRCWKAHAPKGSTLVKGRCRARIRVHGKLIHLGYFDDPATASAAYMAAAEKHFGEFARAA